MGRDKNGASPHDRAMELSSTLAWLVDAAADSAGANPFLAELGAHLIADGLTLAGAGSQQSPPAPYTRTPLGEGTTGLSSPGSARVRSLRARPMTCMRLRASPRRRLPSSPRAPR